MSSESELLSEALRGAEPVLLELAAQVLRDVGKSGPWVRDPLEVAWALDRLGLHARGLAHGRVRVLMGLAGGPARSTWRSVGDRFGVSRQAATERFRRRVIA